LIQCKSTRNARLYGIGNRRVQKVFFKKQQLGLLGLFLMIRVRFSKNTIIILLAIMAAAPFIFVTVYISNERCFDDLASIPKRTVNENRQCMVGIIGDSWAAGKKLDEPVHNVLFKNGIDVVVVSSGHPRAKSRQIYRDLFLPSQEPYSSSAILMDNEIAYLVIVAGVNDTAGHIEKDLYTHHILAIAKTALELAITPVIVEVPEYGIEQTAADSIQSWAKRTLFRYLYDHGKVDVIEDYRRQLRTAVAAYPEGNKIIVLNFDPVVTDYASQKNLLANPSHLNADGIKKLGKVIDDGIKHAHNRRYLGMNSEFL
jgi:hypothetical protein